MGTGLAWAQRFDSIEAAIKSGDLPDLRSLPPLISIEEVRATIAEDPPLESEYIAKDIFDKGNGVVYIVGAVIGIVMLAAVAKTLAVRPIEWFGLAIDIVGAPFVGVVFALPLAAMAQPVTVWVLNTFVQPRNVEAATQRAFAAAQERQAYLESARTIWLWGRSLAAWRTADGPTFERLTARAFRNQGWNVEIVGGANDGGVDLRLRRAGELVLVQCKAHARPLSPAVVRELYGALLHEGASSAILVCLSGVSKAAAAWVTDKPIRIMTPDQLVSPP